MNGGGKITKGLPHENRAGDHRALGVLVQIMLKEGDQKDRLFRA